MLRYLLLLLACTKLSLSDFFTPPCELKDAYGYENIPNDVDYHDWTLVSGNSSTDGIAGPPSGRENTTDDCYLLYSAKGDPPENGVIVSPCYVSNDSNVSPMLRFYHYTHGKDVGALHVSLQQGCRKVTDWTVEEIRRLDSIWSVFGSHENSWTEENLTLSITYSLKPFQVLFDAVVGTGNSNIGIDEICIVGTATYTYPTTNTPNTSLPTTTKTPTSTTTGLTGLTTTQTTDISEIETTTQEISSKVILTSTNMYTSPHQSTASDESGPTKIPSTESILSTTSLLLLADATFCERTDLVGFDNCSFIGIAVAASIIFIVFLIWLVAFTYNRYVAPARQKSRAVSNTGVTSFVDAENNSVTHADNGHVNATVLQTITEQESGTNDHNRKVSTTTFGVDSHKDESDANSKIKSDEDSEIPDGDKKIDEDEAEASYDFVNHDNAPVVPDSTEPLPSTSIDDVNDEVVLTGFKKRESVANPRANSQINGEIASSGEEIENKDAVPDLSNSENASLSHDKTAEEKTEPVKPIGLPRGQSFDSGYSKIEINSPEESSEPMANSASPAHDDINEGSTNPPANRLSAAYEDVNIGDMKPPETRRPTLPEGHPSLTPPIKEKPKSKKQPVIIAPQGKLTSIAENMSNANTTNSMSPEIPVYSQPDKTRKSKLLSESDDIALLYTKPDKRKSSGYSKIDDKSSQESPEAQERAYNSTYEQVGDEFTKQSEGRRPTLPHGHPSLSGEDISKAQPNGINPGATTLIGDDNDVEPYAETVFTPPNPSTKHENDKYNVTENSSEEPNRQDEKDITNGQNAVNDSANDSGWVDNRIYSST